MPTHAATSQSELESFPTRLEAAGGGWVRRATFAVAVVSGWLVLMPALHSVWRIWVSDPLRSIGLFVPIAAVVLILREWRRLGWESYPSWWGLPPLALSIIALEIRPLVVTLQATRWAYLSLRGGASIDLLPDGVVITLYAAAFLLMLGGKRVFMRALPAVLLLLLVNPVPNVFSLLDLPLQHYSADLARHFAILIGARPDGAQLQLMFTPDFGMFIAPGCDGIRGAVTMAYLALFASFWRELSIPLRLLAGFSGLVLGYLFNFVRLCLLVIYYKIGESIPSIQPHGAMVDYVIGGTLFFLASIAFWRIFFSDRAQAAVVANEPVPKSTRFTHGRTTIVVFLAVSAVVAVANLRAFASEVRAGRLSKISRPPEAQLPASVGTYRLVTTWDEYLVEGFKAYRWGRYTNGRPGDDVLLGLWVAGNDHNPADCHIVRGEQLEPGSNIVHHTSEGTTVYSTFTYDDGLNRVFAASTICNRCYGGPKLQSSFGPLTVSIGKRTDDLGTPFVGSILIKYENPDQTSKDSAQVREFISNLNESQIMNDDSR
jgi:exosortase J